MAPLKDSVLLKFSIVLKCGGYTNIDYIGRYCSVSSYHFKCSSSLQEDGFWLAVNVFIIH